jgi:hypothetical protein
MHTATVQLGSDEFELPKTSHASAATPPDRSCALRLHND